MNNYLTAREVAEIKQCSVRYIQRCINDGKIVAETQISVENKCTQYLIPVESLPTELQQIYYGEQKAVAEDSNKTALTLTANTRQRDDYSESEREIIAFWCDTLRQWRTKRTGYESLEEGDMVFLAETKRIHKDFLQRTGIKLSRDILYRKYKHFVSGDYSGLIEARGGANAGKSSIPEDLAKVFNDLYLCDRQLPIADCYRLTCEWARENRPELAADMPSERTFRRAAEKLPEAVVKYFRHSVKECIDECLPYIIRLYDGIEANDVWVADNHTFDFMSLRDGEEKPHRLYITGILDAKSGMLVGWNITNNPCSESTVLALRHAIMRCGVPKVLYVDNGTEFLTHDLGGKGHRARKSQANVPVPPTILDRLGIKMVNALVCNGRAKPIERTFLTLKNTISRLMTTYTGGTVVERPESLKWQLKHGIIPYDRQMIERLNLLLDGYNGSPYGGCEPQFDGMTRAQAWSTSIKRRGLITCDTSTLDLMLMRTSRYQKVKENGVYITISGEKLWYNCGEDNWRYVGQEVYVRYDPADLEYVRVYDKDDRYMASWCLDRSVWVDYITVDTDDIADRQRLIGHQIKAIKACGAELTGNMRIDALALAAAEANRKIYDGTPELPQSSRKLYASEQELLPKAVGGGEDEVDLNAMAIRAAERLQNV